MTVHPPFEKSYAELGGSFSVSINPTPVAAPRLVAFNDQLARDLGFDPTALRSAEGIGYLAGNDLPEGAQPISTAYAGHQFGNFVPQLGDGRAILLGEVFDTRGARRDIQLKGSGRTPFSRGGDGRAALGPVLREYLVSEAMAALGIPTTRALAAVATGELVLREIALPGAVLTRVASSHIRIGTFQFFAARGDVASLRRLADYAITRHYPEAVHAPNPYVALLNGVIARQAALIARWMLVGFVHGVMNTDNVSIAGETIDYGPCAFLDTYDPATVFSSIDRGGRYAFGNQPEIAQWNLYRFAETLLPLLSDDQSQAIAAAEGALTAFKDIFDVGLLEGARAKLGLATSLPGDRELWESLLACMAAGEADFTLTFRALSAVIDGSDTAFLAQFSDAAPAINWMADWRARLAKEPEYERERSTRMRAANPAFIPRNHRVEEIIEAAIDRQDFQPFERLSAILSRPYEDQPEFDEFILPPAQRSPYRTFCGT